VTAPVHVARRPRTARWRSGGSSSTRARASTGSSPSRSTCATAGRAGHVQDQARAHRGRRRRGVPPPQERARRRFLLLGLYDDGAPSSTWGERRLPDETAAQLVESWSRCAWRTWSGIPGRPGRRSRRTSPRGCRRASRWSTKKDFSWVPLRPERVAEWRTTHGERRAVPAHGPLPRWRPDRTAESCTYSQLDEPVGYDLAEILGRRTDAVTRTTDPRPDRSNKWADRPTRRARTEVSGYGHR